MPSVARFDTSRHLRWLATRAGGKLGLALAALAAAALAGGCGPPADGVGASPRLVLLYATCTLNKRYLSPYRPEVGFTPNLERFAAGARVFDRHQTESGQSGIAYAALFTGTQAMHHGVYRHPVRLADEARLIAEAFADAGWETHGWLEQGMASARLNYGQGIRPENRHRIALRGRSMAFQRVLDRLAADPDARAFLVTNFSVTHGPYKGRQLDRFCRFYPAECAALGPPEENQRLKWLYRQAHLPLSLEFEATASELGLGPEERRRMAALVDVLYKANVFRLDQMFGAVVREIEQRGLLAESLISFTADHGEIGVRDNAWFRWTHGFQLAPEVLDVPWLLAGPGVEAGRHEAVTRSIDVFPTLAGLTGVDPGEVPGLGVDLSASVTGAEPPPELLAFSHTSLMDQATRERYREFTTLARLHPREDPALMWVSVRAGDLFFQLRRPCGERWQPVAFDLAADPGLERDLYDPAEPGHREMVRRLAAYRAELVEGFAGGERELPIDPDEAAELLRGLGYID